MRPRRGRNGAVLWTHADKRNVVGGGWMCRACATPSQKPFRFYCSKECRAKFMASVPPFWSEIRHKAIVRDHFECVLCGASQSADSPLEVDHIEPVALRPDLEFELSNLRTLCHPCHARHGAKPIGRKWLAVRRALQDPLQVRLGGTR